MDITIFGILDALNGNLLRFKYAQPNDKFSVQKIIAQLERMDGERFELSTTCVWDRYHNQPRPPIPNFIIIFPINILMNIWSS